MKRRRWVKYPSALLFLLLFLFLLQTGSRVLPARGSVTLANVRSASYSLFCVAAYVDEQGYRPAPGFEDVSLHTLPSEESARQQLTAALAETTRQLVPDRQQEGHSGEALLFSDLAPGIYLVCGPETSLLLTVPAGASVQVRLSSV